MQAIVSRARAAVRIGTCADLRPTPGRRYILVINLRLLQSDSRFASTASTCASHHMTGHMKVQERSNMTY